jgi:glycosyltransferase involved in cell wall biosynthesis
MKIVIALTYFVPHKSGLTVYAERLSAALARRGHQVTILTSRYNRRLPRCEVIDKVKIVRVDALCRISKGLVMPTLPFHALRLIRQADVLNLHVPQFDAAWMSLLCRWADKPVVLTYQCDLQLPKGPIHWLANRASDIANFISAAAAKAIVVLSQEYAEGSPLLARHSAKLQAILPPIRTPLVAKEEAEAFRKKFQIEPGGPLIGMVARLAAEKGVEVLIQALPKVQAEHPEIRVCFVGPYQHVFGEEAYARRLEPMIHKLGARWRFLGILSDEELAAFYQQCALIVVPSLNRTEAFGMVQIEAILNGSPVVASNLPGVRQPVLETGMGLLFPAADPTALANAILSILRDRNRFLGDPEAIALRFAPEAAAKAYESLFEQVTRSRVFQQR